MTIPRRDLLTGAALVLVGSASGCGGTTSTGGPAGTAGTASTGGTGGTGNSLRTQFMTDFTAKFIGDPTKMKPAGQADTWPDPNRIWPQAGQSRDAVATDFATFVNVLMSVAYVGGPPPTFPSGLLGDQILQFLQAQKWPGTSASPAGYEKTPLGTVNLVEIAVILDRLLQAINSFELAKVTPTGGSGTEKGGPVGGGGTGWPPHTPGGGP